MMVLSSIISTSIYLGWSLTNLFIFNNLSIPDTQLALNTKVNNLIPKHNLTNTIPCSNCVYVTKTTELNTQNNPILNVSIYSDNTLLNSYKAISGRSWSQELDRNVAGNKSPSPKGQYLIKEEIKGYEYETGGVFLPYEPLFSTNRSSLGFHIDVSWGLNNGEDGTQGCIAFKTLEDYDNFVRQIKTNKLTTLIIDY